jgi:hypothetical protein
VTGGSTAFLGEGKKEKKSTAPGPWALSSSTASQNVGLEDKMGRGWGVLATKFAGLCDWIFWGGLSVVDADYANDRCLWTGAGGGGGPEC